MRGVVKTLAAIAERFWSVVNAEPQNRPLKATVRRRVKWFSKQALVQAALYTAEKQLGEPPEPADILKSSEERFPAATDFLLTTRIGEIVTFYRSCVPVNGEWYRVAVTPDVWQTLPEDEFDLPF